MKYLPFWDSGRHKLLGACFKDTAKLPCRKFRSVYILISSVWKPDVMSSSSWNRFLKASVSRLSSGAFLSDVIPRQSSAVDHLKKTHAQRRWKYWDKQRCIMYKLEIHNVKRDPLFELSKEEFVLPGTQIVSILYGLGMSVHMQTTANQWARKTGKIQCCCL